MSSTIVSMELRTRIFAEQAERLDASLADLALLPPWLRKGLVSAAACPFTNADALFAIGDALLDAAREARVGGRRQFEECLRRAARHVDALATQEDRRDF